ncbi:MAG: hypothetical protein M3Z64_12690 [Verrucomicrobiota bacterium]|nr:hypothetical protein [Verrucomicrobiota bacterium]
MHRIPATRRRIEIAILALLLTAQGTIVTRSYLAQRRASYAKTVLNDPLTTAITPTQFGLEVSPSQPAPHTNDRWREYCYHARESLVEQARIASATTSQN